MKRDPYEDEELYENSGCSCSAAAIVIIIAVVATVLYLLTQYKQ